MKDFYANKKKVIITDDDPGVQDSFRIILERAGYEVVVFPDGNQLLSGAFEHPDLIILDKQLAGVDGLDICRHLKEDKATASIPVIVLSATPHIDRLAIAAGADGFLEKPVKMKRLLEVVEAAYHKSGRVNNAPSTLWNIHPLINTPFCLFKNGF